MSRKVGFGIAAAIGLLVVGIVVRQWMAFTAPGPRLAVGHASSDATVSTVREAPIPKAFAMPTKTAMEVALQELSPECRLHAAAVFKLDLTPFAQDSGALRLNDAQVTRFRETYSSATAHAAQCMVESPTSYLQYQLKTQLAACVPPPETSDPAPLACLAAVRDLQYQVLVSLNLKTPIEKIEDPSLARALTIGMFQRALGPGETGNRLHEFASRYAELAPRDPLAHRLATQSAYLLMKRSSGAMAFAHELNVRRAVEQAESVLGPTPTIAEVSLTVAKFRSDATGLAQMARRYQKELPESEIGGFYLVQAQMMAGETEEAKLTVQDLAKRFPKSHRVAVAQRRLQSELPPTDNLGDVFGDARLAISFEAADPIGGVSRGLASQDD